MSKVVRVVEESSTAESCRARITHVASGARREIVCDIPRAAVTLNDEDVRWYIEEYLQFPFDPAPAVAEDVERQIGRAGVELFRATFDSSAEARAIWEQIRGSLESTRFEIEPTSPGALSWELLRSPVDAVPIACKSQAFVRTPRGAARPPPAGSNASALRVLMVIARPEGAADVQLRSVASRVLHRLGERTVDLEVLRPPTFDALEQRLRLAHTHARPYTILHFDGHGIYDDLYARHLKRPAATRRGYLEFEDIEGDAKRDYVDGERLAELLLECGTRIVLLNACRSGAGGATWTPDDSSAAAQSFSSLAEELIGYGIAAVVAMRHNIYIDAAALFIASVYDALANGAPVADAVNRARRELFDNPYRTTTSSPRRLQDWIVPIIYESEALTLQPQKAPSGAASVDTSTLPPPPQCGFVGRDDAILNLDRELRASGVVLLHGLAGVGKTATATELGRWLAQTGGVARAVIFTSLRDTRSFDHIVDAAATDARQPQSLWIWDNIESASELWSKEDIERAARFLEQSGRSGARILLTARTSGVEWLPTSVAEVHLSPMETTEQIELARAIVGPEPTFDASLWMPLLNLSQGNPFVLSLVVREALARRIPAKEIASFAAELRATMDADALFDESIVHTLTAEFTRDDLRLLSLCHLCEGAVSPFTLAHVSAGAPHSPSEPEPAPTSAVNTARALLDRAARAGLLTPLSAGYYAGHPGLRLHLQRIFGELYSPDEATRLVSRFVELNAMIARAFAGYYESGEAGASDVAIATFKVNEPSLRRAFELARERGMWGEAVTILAGWRVLMTGSGRWSELARMLDEVADDIARAPREHLDEGDALVNAIDSMRVQVLEHEHRLAEAERLQREIVTRRRGALRERGVAKEHLELALAAGLERLGTIMKDRGSRAECLAVYREALELAQRRGDVRLERAVAYQTALAHMHLAPPDLEEADYWLSYTSDITPGVDRIGRGTLLAAKGSLALLRWNASTGPEGAKWRREAIKHFETALTILPPSHSAASVCHANLGLAYFSEGGDVTRSMQSFEQALSYYEAAGAEGDAGVARLNLAKVLEAAGDLEKARLYAEAALLTFASLAPDAEGEVLEAQNFLESLNEAV